VTVPGRTVASAYPRLSPTLFATNRRAKVGAVATSDPKPRCEFRHKALKFSQLWPKAPQASTITPRLLLTSIEGLT